MIHDEEFQSLQDRVQDIDTDINTLFLKLNTLDDTVEKLITAVELLNKKVS